MPTVNLSFWGLVLSELYNSFLIMSVHAKQWNPDIYRNASNPHCTQDTREWLEAL